MDNGWIKLHRKMMDNPLWQDKPFSKGQAWIDLILLANHSEKTVMHGNEILELQPGQLHTSELKLAERWGWSRNKVRAYLNVLQSLKMSTVQGTTKGTTITIENYTLYQSQKPTESADYCTEEGQRKNNERTTKKQRKEHKQECKELKNVKNEKNDKNILGDEVAKQPKPKKEIYGEYDNVKLTATDFEKLKNEFPSDYQERIDRLSEYMASKGDKYKSHLATIRSWAKRDCKKHESKPDKPIGTSFLDL